jgi:hypothetical protein
MISLEWEDVKQEPTLSGFMRRAKVSNGWIYLCVDDMPVDRPDVGLQYGLAWHTSMCFVPDHPFTVEDFDRE